MTIDQTVADALDETIKALTILDLNRLQTLEERISALAKYSIVCSKGSLSSILAKKHLLELILQNCESNLATLHRLHGRDTRDQWAH
ncbi:hypothetical protein HDF09_000339 [Edaphobacter lichenicola]|uniref:Uncharacterized protein n=1 Tax=Tunturiibacter empetritectus TaxID=3069691 RepID=A0A7W8MQX8_9BACT|nr:hypothetical protein [Edaphobacter lichenicola]